MHTQTEKLKMFIIDIMTKAMDFLAVNSMEVATRVD